jgi:hypothetical protein
MSRFLWTIFCCLVFIGCQKAETPDGKKTPGVAPKQTSTEDKKTPDKPVAKTVETAAKTTPAEAAPKTEPQKPIEHIEPPKASPEERAQAIAGVLEKIEALDGTVEKNAQGKIVRIDLVMKLGGDDDLKLLSDTPALEKLYLEGPNFTDKAFEHIKGLPNLKVLSMESTSTKDDGLAQLSAVKSLSALMLRSTEITNDGMRPLHQHRG